MQSSAEQHNTANVRAVAGTGFATRLSDTCGRVQLSAEQHSTANVRAVAGTGSATRLVILVGVQPSVKQCSAS